MRPRKHHPRCKPKGAEVKSRCPFRPLGKQRKKKRPCLLQGERPTDRLRLVAARTDAPAVDLLRKNHAQINPHLFAPFREAKAGMPCPTQTSLNRPRPVVAPSFSMGLLSTGSLVSAIESRTQMKAVGRVGLLAYCGDRASAVPAKKNWCQALMPALSCPRPFSTLLAAPNLRWLRASVTSTKLWLAVLAVSKRLPK